ncbi:spidroin-1-like [Pipistrellus kuhlii]|uniref:spidroin-1-like n=1 Tax=Pipistrellus kuhlii TaxID=59472 RepID=UPI001E270B05|nr:spidroin-1-like [Pipistrellus kuhlii]
MAGWQAQFAVGCRCPRVTMAGRQAQFAVGGLCPRVTMAGRQAQFAVGSHCPRVTMAGRQAWAAGHRQQAQVRRGRPLSQGHHGRAAGMGSRAQAAGSSLWAAAVPGSPWQGGRHGQQGTGSRHSSLWQGHHGRWQPAGPGRHLEDDVPPVGLRGLRCPASEKGEGTDLCLRSGRDREDGLGGQTAGPVFISVSTGGLGGGGGSAGRGHAGRRGAGGASGSCWRMNSPAMIGGEAARGTQTQAAPLPPSPQRPGWGAGSWVCVCVFVSSSLPGSSVPNGLLGPERVGTSQEQHSSAGWWLPPAFPVVAPGPVQSLSWGAQHPFSLCGLGGGSVSWGEDQVGTLPLSQALP